MRYKKKNMKKVIVTPAGRKKYLEILSKYLVAYKDEFDRWDIWVNTTEYDDIDYIINLGNQYDFIRVIPNPIPPSEHFHKGTTIHPFFKYCIKEDECYLRLDDDIVFIKKGSLETLFQRRLELDEPFLLFGNIFNNAIITHLHQRFGLLPTKYGIVGYYCTDEIGWGNPYFAAKMHKIFLQDTTIDLSFPNWILNMYEQCSINVISWTGKEFAKFNGIVESDEEQFLTMRKPAQLRRPNMIIGDTLFVHWAFFTQRPFLDSTEILQRYKEIADAL